MQDRKDAITEGTYLRDLSVFEKDLFPVLGDTPIDQIKGKDILACAKKIEDTWRIRNGKTLHSFD